MFTGSHNLFWRCSHLFPLSSPYWCHGKQQQLRKAQQNHRFPPTSGTRISPYITSSSSHITHICPHFLKKDKSGIVQSPEEAEESMCLKIKRLPWVSEDTHTSPLSSQCVALYAGRGPARALVNMLDVCLEEMPFCLHGRERSLEKKPGTEQLGFG